MELTPPGGQPGESYSPNGGASPECATQRDNARWAARAPCQSNRTWPLPGPV